MFQLHWEPPGLLVPVSWSWECPPWEDVRNCHNYTGESGQKRIGRWNIRWFKKCKHCYLEHIYVVTYHWNQLIYTIGQRWFLWNGPVIVFMLKSKVHHKLPLSKEKTYIYTVIPFLLPVRNSDIDSLCSEGKHLLELLHFLGYSSFFPSKTIPKI